ncbi:MAG: histone deacetylase [Chloroherpetonaceae bacterium]|nr:histone deacetylase [Chloroherpetonaceae bacterium]
MKVFYSDKYTIPLPPDHRFPMVKYKLVKEGLLNEGILSIDEIFEPHLATQNELLLAHTASYVNDVFLGTLNANAIRKIGFPWSEGLVQRSQATVGGAIDAAYEALQNGISGNLAGGTHHAFADSGEGYCVFNDLAVVCQLLLSTNEVQRIAIIDLDVHQGNGNAAILGQNPQVFIFSMHGEKNYPFRKVASTLDIGLPDGTSDEGFLFELKKYLPSVFSFNPELVLYQAGVDPLFSDALGRLSLSHEGLVERDRLVLAECRKRSIPISLALGGGYAKPIEDTVKAHLGTYRVAKELF